MRTRWVRCPWHQGRTHGRGDGRRHGDSRVQSIRKIPTVPSLGDVAGHAGGARKTRSWPTPCSRTVLNNNISPSAERIQIPGITWTPHRIVLFHQVHKALDALGGTNPRGSDRAGRCGQIDDRASGRAGAASRHRGRRRAAAKPLALDRPLAAAAARQPRRRCRVAVIINDDYLGAARGARRAHLAVPVLVQLHHVEEHGLAPGRHRTRRLGRAT